MERRNNKYHIVKHRWTHEVTYLVPEIGQDVTTHPSTWPREAYVVSSYLDEETTDESYTYIRMVDLDEEPTFWEENVSAELNSAMRD